MKIKREENEYRGKKGFRVGVKTEPHTEDGYEFPGLEEVLIILEGLFISEDIRYPKEKGFKGRDMFFSAIQDLWKGIDIPKILTKYNVPRRYVYLHDILVS